jgi:hypothetical protein
MSTRTVPCVAFCAAILSTSARARSSPILVLSRQNIIYARKEFSAIVAPPLKSLHRSGIHSVAKILRLHPAESGSVHDDLSMANRLSYTNVTSSAYNSSVRVVVRDFTKVLSLD